MTVTPKKDTDARRMIQRKSDAYLATQMVLFVRTIEEITLRTRRGDTGIVPALGFFRDDSTSCDSEFLSW